jgi:hypothetical protein
MWLNHKIEDPKKKKEKKRERKKNPCFTTHFLSPILHFGNTLGEVAYCNVSAILNNLQHFCHTLNPKVKMENSSSFQSKTIKTETSTNLEQAT